jgi:hypothetical protein
MRQLQFFTTAELTVMRDRTRSRNHCPERDQFRREHERHRAWGLTQRHARKLRRRHGGTHDSPVPNAIQNDPDDETAELSASRLPESLSPERANSPAMSPNGPAEPDPSPGHENQTDHPGPVRSAPPGPAGKAPSSPAGKAPSSPAGKAPSGPAGKAPSWLARSARSESARNANPDPPANTGSTSGMSSMAGCNSNECRRRRILTSGSISPPAPHLYSIASPRPRKYGQLPP